MNVIAQFLALLLSLSALSSSSKACHKTLISSFSIDLIHRDSAFSPFYNSSLSHSQVIMKAARRSISRIKHFQGGGDGAVLSPNRGDYLMKIFLGTPLVELHAAADTGSDLVWVPCLPCGGCDPQNAFDPAKSSTFTVLPCDSQPCGSLPRQSCGNSNQCRYGDQSFTTGDIATETINFGNTFSSPSTVIGCGHDNQFEDNTGIAGLGGGPLSLISQLGDQISHTFSYCLLPFSSNSTSRLKFGNDVVASNHGDQAVAIVSTPLFTKTPTTFYYVNLEAVTVGHNTVHTGQTGGNIVIDSGTTLTVLESGFYSELRDAVRQAVGVEPVSNPPDPLDLCFRYDDESAGMVQREGLEFVLHFTNGDLKLHRGNMFTIEDDLLCLMVIPSDGMSILGNIAQVNFQVAFDLVGRKVSFAPADCAAN
ncbi:aspartic proteinase CDR1-like isoform X2 [Prosopis cineraria]|uniref:aspartic proteinase CDR1-like isoform X2 n=1 Tax=Prosopis cineraria TaxID=364024 RepID=UPI0024109752|nr:aspartic proteinase CDR1-like isoform X2 [Prosopis cineraria]